MGFMIVFFLIWFCAFMIARLFSFYTKSHWKDEALITGAQALVMILIFNIISNDYLDIFN